MDTIKGLAPPIVVGYLNYGVVDVNGLDASITYFINRSLSFDLHYSYLNISDFLNPITNSKDPINAPKNKGGFKIQYEPSDKPYSFSLNFRYLWDIFSHATSKWSDSVCKKISISESGCKTFTSRCKKALHEPLTTGCWFTLIVNKIAALLHQTFLKTKIKLMDFRT